MPRISAPPCPICGSALRRAYIRQAGTTLNGYRPIAWACREGHWAEGDRQLTHAKDAPPAEPPRETVRVITDRHAFESTVHGTGTAPIDSTTWP